MNTSKVPVQDDEISTLQEQLASSLKFHHHETLRKIPLEIAVRVISEVWASCHPEDFPEYCSGDSTAIIPKGKYPSPSGKANTSQMFSQKSSQLFLSRVLEVLHRHMQATDF